MVDVLDNCLPLSQVRQLDAQLSALARGQAALCLRVGALANSLGPRGGFAELGFSRAGDYAVQRCGRTSGWFTECRGAARRLETLPALRAAVCGGELSWSMAVLCARKTIPDREVEVLARAKKSTVRQMRAYFGEVSALSSMPQMQPEPSRWNGWEELEQLAMCDEEGSVAQRNRGAELTAMLHDDGEACTAPTCGVFTSGEGAGSSTCGDAAGEPTDLDDDDACIYDRITRHTVQRTVPEAVAFKLEATRILLDHLEGGTMSQDQMMEAMLAEAQTKLEVSIDFDEMRSELACADETRRNWLKTKRAIDEAAQAACEPRLPSPEPADVLLEEGPIPETPEEIDL